jgi:prophage antirepressor-like protein
MNSLIPFKFENRDVRVVVIDGAEWWVGRDVCEALGYTNPNKAMGDHCKGVTKRYPLETAAAFPGPSASKNGFLRKSCPKSVRPGPMCRTMHCKTSKTCKGGCWTLNLTGA